MQSKRIKGLEVEWAIQHRGTNGSRPLTGNDIFDNFIIESLSELGFSYLPSNDHKGVYLSNGARFYPDSGGHTEYALPECNTLAELLHHDRAGELLIQELSPLISQLMKKRHQVGFVYFTKNNLDGRGITYGCHENYSLREKKVGSIQEFNNRFGVSFIPFLIARQLLCGAGTILPDVNGDYCWRTEPRAEFMEFGASLETTSKRGLINLKDEPLTGEKKGEYRRLQLILSGANRNPYSTYYKIGLTEIVINLFEEGIERIFLPGTTTPIIIPMEFQEERGQYKAAVDFYKALSRDSQASVTLKSGHQITGIEILKAYYLTAEKNRHLFNPELQTCLTEWGQALTWLEEGDNKALQRRVDSRLKRKIIETYLAQRGFDFDRLRSLSPLIRFIKEKKIESFIYDWAKQSETWSTQSLYLFLKDRSSTVASELECLLTRTGIDPVTLPNVLHVANGVVERDLRYQDPTPKSPFELAQRQGFIDLPPGYEPNKAEEARKNPPLNRAALRSRFIKKYPNGLAQLNWDRALSRQGKTIVQWPDPYSFSDEPEI